ncbi:DUF1801 domain-containing protein [Thalassotalea sp. 1_MG-2023]|uniref:DUF1801 domain-containing protein n=1 Tax=Thalassotalea sp. 1_MG-2023 TaxID=3062680 RepID=UPI0026E196E7|nr:DUF1801 domain-containing protein [Thalassotalea sp. 1_MG-2023]MDO6427924.1 DUF1801 domain-containing protein [Thalassotalea sp. 1_MG-2023]
MEQKVKDKFDSYPDDINALLIEIRSMILQLASTHVLGDVTESLKWGEPSYSVKSGSPIRMDWKDKTPENYYLFFNCNTKLIATFRELYANELEFQGNRAIVLKRSSPLPKHVLSQCLRLGLTYQQIKHLPLLGQ